MVGSKEQLFSNIHDFRLFSLVTLTTLNFAPKKAAKLYSGKESLKENYFKRSMTSSSNAVKGFVENARCGVAGVLARKYTSDRTGLIVYLAQVEGPLVNGYLCLGKKMDYAFFHSIVSIISKTDSQEAY